MALFILAVLSGACQKPSSVITQRGSSKDIYPDQESWESRIIISQNGQPIALADSRRMVKFNNQNTAHLIGEVKIDFYNEQGDHVSRLFADSADINLDANHLSAFGHVMILSDSGLVLRTETLRWDDTYNMMATDDSVMFNTPDGDTLYGVGFESDIDLTHWTIYKPWGVTERGFRAAD